jgi:hypothetical protein
MRLNKGADCIYIGRMKRSLVFLAAIAIALPALSFDPVKHNGALRMTILQEPVAEGGYVDRVARRVHQQLVDELRDRGFDAIDGRASFDDISRGGRRDSDIYVEIAPAAESTRPLGGVGVNLPNATVDVAVVVSRVAAELRIYDGKTLNLIARRHLNRSSTTIVPTSVGVGTYRMSVWFALPFVEYVRYRNAVNNVVHDAATEIAGVVR